MMLKKPCIRGLKEFKNGCPGMAWSEKHSTGCPAWIEREMFSRGGMKKTKFAECLDHWTAKLQYDTNVLLEGVQQAVETFRNNATIDGSPKPDPAVKEFMQILKHKMIGQ